MKAIAYPDGTPVAVGDIIWNNEGLNVRKVTEIITDDNKSIYDLDKTGFFWSRYIGKRDLDSLGYESKENFHSEGVAKLSIVELLCIKILFRLLGKQLGLEIWDHRDYLYYPVLHPEQQEHTAGSGICSSSHTPHPSKPLTKKNATVLMKTASPLSEWTERHRIGSGGFEMSVQLPFLYPLEAGRLHATLSAKNTRIDETEAVATRPLAIQKDGAWYTYGHDLTKNVWELYKANGTIASTYDYRPFGGVTANGTAEQPFQWSSEFYDSELGMVYYNFRFYNPLDGRWISRDPIGENIYYNLYAILANNTLNAVDFIGTLPRHCYKIPETAKLNEFGCLECEYQCECPQGYWSGYGGRSVIIEACSEGDDIIRGTCTRRPPAKKKPERKKVYEFDEDGKVISDLPSTKTQTRRVPWSTAPNPPRRTIPVYVPQSPLINMSRPLTGSFGESIIIVGGAMYIAALLGAAAGGGILISM